MIKKVAWSSWKLSDSQRRVKAVLRKVEEEVLPLMNEERCQELLVFLRDQVVQPTRESPLESVDYDSQPLEELLALESSSSQGSGQKKKKKRNGGKELGC